MENATIPSVSIAALVTRRAALADRLREVFDILETCKAITDSLHAPGPADWLGGDPYRGAYGRSVLSEPDPLAACLKSVDRGVWSYLMEESGMFSFMDQKARAEWRESLQKGDFPPLTVEAVTGTISSLYEQRGELFERGLETVFRRLSWCYKSNNPFKFGRRVILTYLVSHTRYGFSHGYSNADGLADLDRVFHMLDGKPEPDHRENLQAKLRAELGIGSNSRELETEYFRLRWFKNGNGHLYFLRPDIVAQCNEVIARRFPGALPADRAGAR